MSSSAGSSERKEIETTYFEYGPHRIDIGAPYAYQLNPETDNFSLYSLGGMGLDPSSFHYVTFNFQTDSAAETEELAKRLLRPLESLQLTLLKVPPSKAHLFEIPHIPRDRENRGLYKIKIYEITMEKIQKKTRRGWENLLSTIKIDENKIRRIQQHVYQLLATRSDLKPYFHPFSEQLSSILDSDHIPFFTILHIETLDNKLEVTALKKAITVEKWPAFRNFIWGGIEKKEEGL